MQTNTRTGSVTYYFVWILAGAMLGQFLVTTGVVHFLPPLDAWYTPHISLIRRVCGALIFGSAWFYLGVRTLNPPASDRWMPPLLATAVAAAVNLGVTFIP